METGGKAGNLFEFALLILLGILWGVPFALTKISLTTIPPLTLAATRVSIAIGLAAILLGVTSIHQTESIKTSWIALKMGNRARAV